MANEKLTALTAVTTFSGGDLVYAVTDPAGTPASKKGTIDQIKDYIVTSVGLIDDLTATWTNSGTTYTGLGLDITDTASAAGSWIFRFHKGSTTYFGQRRDGALQFGGPYFALQIPDSSTTGGNARGDNSVDLQTVRTNADQVASGDYSVAIGRNNKASLDTSVAIGYGNTVTNNFAVALGRANTLSQQDTWCLGLGHRISGIRSLALNYGATDRGVTDSLFQGGLSFDDNGDAQSGHYSLSGATTDGTPTVLTTNRGGASTTNQVLLQNDSTYFFEARIVARRTDANDESAAYTLTGCIDRNANAASTALVGSVTKVVVAEDTAAWDVSATADTTNGALAITVTGESGKNIRWVCFVRTVEVAG